MDPALVFHPVPHVGLMFGPTLDIGAGGEWEIENDGNSVDGDLDVSSFGISAGLVVLV